MSFISLGKINTNWGTVEDKFYVAGLIDSQSGLLVPKILRDKNEILTYYGKFEYVIQYQEYINQGIPVVLMPILTPESEYNRPSLRLNREVNYKSGEIDNSIIYCHPKFQKPYKKVQQNNVIVTDIVGRSGWVDISTGIQFYPRVTVIESDNVIQTKVRYRLVNGVTVISVFIQDDSKSYKVIYEVLSECSTLNGRVKIFEEGLGVDYLTIPRFQKDNNPPEYVATYRDGDYDYQVLLDSEFVDNGTLIVNLKNPEVPNITRIDVRYVPDSYITSSKTITEIGTHYLTHSQPKYRIFKCFDRGREFITNCQYVTDTLVAFDIVDDKENLDIVIRYNIISMNLDTIDPLTLSKLLSGIYTLNAVLDFRGSRDFVNQVYRVENPIQNFILLNTTNGQACFSTLKSELELVNVSASNFDEFITISQSSELEDNFLAFIQDFCDTYDSIYQGSCHILYKLLTQYIATRTQYLSLHNEFISKEALYEDLIANSYIEDYWLVSNAVIAERIPEVLSHWLVDKSEYNTDDLVWISTRLGSLSSREIFRVISTNQLDEVYYDQVFIKYSDPSIDPNYFKFGDLSIYESIGYTNDILSQLTEDYKICEFYSIAKGPVGSDITIKITNYNYDERLYNIHISNSLVNEDFLVYLGFKDPDYPAQAIHLDELNKLSKLVFVRTFNYVYSGELVDPQYFEFPIDYIYNVGIVPDDGVEGSLSPKYLKLPIGEWKLDRYVYEEVRTKDIRDSLIKFSESNLYPDLLLIDRIPDIIYKESKYSFDDLISWIYTMCYGSQNPGNSNEITLDPDINNLYTQALINLHKDDIFMNKITSPYVSAQNRIMYFLGDSTIDGIEYSSIYTYVLDIIKSKYLDQISYKINYDPFSFTKGNICLLIPVSYHPITGELLPPEIESITNSDAMVVEIESTYKSFIYIKDSTDYFEQIDYGDYKIFRKPNGEEFYAFNMMSYVEQYKINFLMYNNLRYYYKTLYEPENQLSIFIVRFLTSKISREIFKHQGLLKGSTPSKINSDISSILSNFNRFSDLYDSVNYKYEIIENHLDLEVTSTIKELINTELTINYSLNIKS